MKKQVSVRINLNNNGLMTLDEVMELLEGHGFDYTVLEEFLKNKDRDEVEVNGVAEVDIDMEDVIEEFDLDDLLYHIDPDDLLYHIDPDVVMGHAKRHTPELFPERLMDQMKMEFFVANQERIKFNDLENLVK